jgi:hypothetical protein
MRSAVSKRKVGAWAAQAIGYVLFACLLSAVVGAFALTIRHVAQGIGEHAKAWRDAELRKRVLMCEALEVDEDACRRRVVARCIGRVGEYEDMVLACYRLGGIDAPQRLQAMQP